MPPRVLRATIIGPLVPRTHEVGYRHEVGYHIVCEVACAVQLEGGKARVCVFPRGSVYPSLEVLSVGMAILVEDDGVLPHVEARADLFSATPV